MTADSDFFGGGIDRYLGSDAPETQAMYTVRFETAVYVLHAFQKKARRGSPRRNRRSTRSGTG